MSDNYTVTVTVEIDIDIDAESWNEAEAEGWKWENYRQFATVSSIDVTQNTFGDEEEEESDLDEEV